MPSQFLYMASEFREQVPSAALLSSTFLTRIVPGSTLLCLKNHFIHTHHVPHYNILHLVLTSYLILYLHYCDFLVDFQQK